MPKSIHYDVIIVGAGAAGLMCAWQLVRQAKQYGIKPPRTLIIEHKEVAGSKIAISGGGRCNFTNLNMGAEYFDSQNLHFCKSALSRFPPTEFVALLDQAGILYREKEPGQLFCKRSAREVTALLVAGATDGGTQIIYNTTIKKTRCKAKNDYQLETSQGMMECKNLVIATGGLSVPKLGASDFGFRLARQFSIPVISTAAALVPFRFSDPPTQTFCKTLSGVSFPAVVTIGPHQQQGELLLTHRGMSGPVILKISLYWNPGDTVYIDMLPTRKLLPFLDKARSKTPKRTVQRLLSQYLPNKLVQALGEDLRTVSLDQPIATWGKKQCDQLAKRVHRWQVKPSSTEGYRTAEATRGGVDTASLSSKTLESKTQQGLYFIGEVVDVTGQLGGYNFQWAWASAYCAAQALLK